MPEAADSSEDRRVEATLAAAEQDGFGFFQRQPTDVSAPQSQLERGPQSPRDSTLASAEQDGLSQRLPTDAYASTRPQSQRERGPQSVIPRDVTDKGRLPALPLKNRYFAMRHGQSEANAAGIIVSDPANGCPRYGLTPLGRQQVYWY